MKIVPRMAPAVVVAAVLIASFAIPPPSSAYSAGTTTAASTASVWVDVASGAPKNPGHVNDPHLPCVALALYANIPSSTGYGYGYGGGPVTGSYVVLDSKLRVNRHGQWSYLGPGDQRIAVMGTFKNGHWLWAMASDDLTLIKAGSFWVAGCR